MRTSVLSYLEETAEKMPDKVAFFDVEHEITFSELRKKSIDLSIYINENLKGRNNPVLVYLPKTIESIVVFMGILYSGNFYTPTDIRFPREKIKSIVDTLKPSAIIVNSETKEMLKKMNIGNILQININEASVHTRIGGVRQHAS